MWRYRNMHRVGDVLPRACCGHLLSWPAVFGRFAWRACACGHCRFLGGSSDARSVHRCGRRAEHIVGVCGQPRAVSDQSLPIGSRRHPAKRTRNVSLVAKTVDRPENKVINWHLEKDFRARGQGAGEHALTARVDLERTGITSPGRPDLIAAERDRE